MRSLSWTLLLAVALGCKGGSSDDDSEVDCHTCADQGDLCATYADGEPGDWTDVCVSLPSACNVDDPCNDDDCIRAMYAACDDGYIGQSYSCQGDYVGVTCSPDA